MKNWEDEIRKFNAAKADAEMRALQQQQDQLRPRTYEEIAAAEAARKFLDFENNTGIRQILDDLNHSTSFWGGKGEVTVGGNTWARYYNLSYTGLSDAILSKELAFEKGWGRYPVNRPAGLAGSVFDHWEYGPTQSCIGYRVTGVTPIPANYCVSIYVGLFQPMRDNRPDQLNLRASRNGSNAIFYSSPPNQDGFSTTSQPRWDWDGMKTYISTSLIQQTAVLAQDGTPFAREQQAIQKMQQLQTQIGTLLPL